jgi:hypothetical protein
MAIFIDQIVTHTPGTGDDTVPPGIAPGNSWCHCVSDVSVLELIGFLTLNILTIGALSTDIRTPALGSLQTYIGLDGVQRAAAIVAGASPQRNATATQLSFDSPHSSSPPYWEP